MTVKPTPGSGAFAATRMLARPFATMALLMGGCAAAPPVQWPAPEDARAPALSMAAPPPAGPLLVGQVVGQVVGRNDRMLIYRPAEGESLGDVARRFLGGDDLAWTIAEANEVESTQPGVPLWVPLQAVNPLGVLPDRIRTVPILCYHRFGSGRSKLIVSPERFAAQLEWLSRSGHRVIRLSALQDFLAGRRPLPPKAVVITIDDGFESVHRHAYPLLRRYGFPATLFVYTDFIGAGDALRWPQLQEMSASGLIDVQAHSKTHRNLTERAADESEQRYLARIETEMAVPRELLQQRLAPTRVHHLAYPYGDADPRVIDAARRSGYELGLTVVSGPNAFYAQPMLLRRTMIFGDLDLEGFKGKLQTEQPMTPQ